MVKIFSPSEAEYIAQATTLAEQRTSAEIVTVVIPKSDRYISEMMFYGFILGSVIAFVLWEIKGLTNFPVIFLIQLLCMLILPLMPGIYKVFLYFLPKKLLFHRASHLGAEELLAIMQKVPPQTPVVLLFISLAEHYIHLFTNPVVKNGIEDKHWDELINRFTVKLKVQTLTQTCSESIAEIADILEPVFPDDAGKNWYVETTAK